MGIIRRGCVNLIVTRVDEGESKKIELLLEGDSNQGGHLKWIAYEMDAGHNHAVSDVFLRG